MKKENNNTYKERKEKNIKNQVEMFKEFQKNKPRGKNVSIEKDIFRQFLKDKRDLTREFGKDEGLVMLVDKYKSKFKGTIL